MKIIITTILFIILIAIIVVIVALTNWGMGIGESYIDKNSKEAWAPDYMMFVANTYYYTFREGRAVGVFEKFIAMYPDNPRVPEASFKRACCFQEMKLRDKAIEAFKKFAADFPDNPDAAEATRRAALIRYVQ